MIMSGVPARNDINDLTGTGILQKSRCIAGEMKGASLVLFIQLIIKTNHFFS